MNLTLSFTQEPKNSLPRLFGMILIGFSANDTRLDEARAEDPAHDLVRVHRCNWKFIGQTGRQEGRLIWDSTRHRRGRCFSSEEFRNQARFIRRVNCRANLQQR